MLSVWANWVYVFITTGVIGHFILKKSAAFVKYNGKISLVSELLAGIALVTTYAGYFSVFHRVSLAANAILLLSCLIFIFLDRKDYFDIAKSIFAGIRECFLGNKIILFIRLTQLAIVAVIILGSLFLTSYGVFHSDSGLYHAQAIRWIEEYGVIKGLALTQNRFAYNSSFFCLSALYSFAFLGQSLHTLNGYMAAISMIYSLSIIINNILIYFFQRNNKEKKLFSYTNILCLAPFIYTVIGGLELVSPTTDPFLIFLVFIIVIMWAKLVEDRNERATAPFAFLCVMMAFLISIKLSVGVLVLLVIKPAYELIKEKKIRDIVFYILLTIVLVAPYFIRNVIISSWIIYPFTAIDLFNYPWKIPFMSAQNDAYEITTWARYVCDASKIDQSLFEWAPVWWKGQTATDRWFSGAAIIASGVEIIRLVRFALLWIIAVCKKKDRNNEWICTMGDYLFLELIIFLGTLFWFFSAPLIRYGYLYLILLSLVVISGLIANYHYSFFHRAESNIHTHKEAFSNKSFQLEFSKFAALFSLIIAIVLIGLILRPTLILALEDKTYVLANWNSDYAIHQKEYPVSDTMTREVNGVIFYYPKVPGKPVWYDAFPSVLYEENLDYFEFIGDDISEGLQVGKD